MERRKAVPTLAAGIGLFLLAACGGPNTSGMALGRVGDELRGYATTVPQGGEVCFIHDALAAQPGQPEKPMNEACVKQMKNDRAWRRAFITLAAYGEMLEEIAGGEGDKEKAGRLEAAEAGVDGADFSGIDGADVSSARDAMQSLSKLMATNDAKGDLGKILKAAAPHVHTLCDGLTPYLEKQATDFHDVQADLQKKREGKTDLRCGSVDGKNVCVGESTLDKSVYAATFSQLMVLEDAHRDAGAALAGFCSAHKKLEAAADAGNLDSAETYDAVVDAVKSAHGGGSSAAPSTTPEKDDKKDEKK